MTDALEPGPHTKGCSGVPVIVMPLSISPPNDGNVPSGIKQQLIMRPGTRVPAAGPYLRRRSKRLATVTMLTDNGALLVVIAASGG